MTLSLGGSPRAASSTRDRGFDILAALDFVATTAVLVVRLCVMLGHELLDGNAWRRDVERARKVLPIACSRGEADPACQAARQLQNR